jgi:PAS domain S-box-containing protein
MAVALKERRPIKGAEAVAERPDGTRVPFLAYPTPLHDESGALVGAVNMLVDITERKRAEYVERLHDSIVVSSDDAIITKDLNGIIATWNQGAERLFGYAADEVIGKPIAILIPSDRHNEEPRILERIRRGDRIDHYETVRRRKDGSLVEISLAVSPIRDAEGRIIGASKIARDITERRRAQEQQKLLLKEMSHRVKNLFALASGVVTLSTPFAGTPENMAVVVRERLGALSRAHELTMPDLTEGAEKVDRVTTLEALVQTIVSPYTDPERKQRVIVRGPGVLMGGSTITSFALVLHELATNAAKYGSLSSPRGRVDVDCSIEGDQLLLTWKEVGGPPINGPAESEGFGSFLVGKTVAGHLHGEMSRDWQPDGLIVHLSVALTILTK